MNFIRRYQTVLLFVLIVVVAFVAYQYLLAPSSESALTATNSLNANGPDQDLIALLLELKSLRLDNVLFDDSIFKSLQDFSKDLVGEPQGRPNPFAPLGATIGAGGAETAPILPTKK